MGSGLRRDQLLALMVAELDGTRRGVGDVRVIEWSDEARRDRAAVELLGAYADGREVVVEHTRIESFEDQTRDRAAHREVFERGGPVLERDDAAYFMLGVEPGAFASIPYLDRALVRDVITDWVREHLDHVPWPHVPGRSILLHGQHPAVPFRWTLDRAVDDSIELCGPLANVVGVSYAMPPDLDARRRTRMVRALNDKVPKLLKAAEPSRYAILVVEERDRVLSSPAHVATALHAAAGSRALPDAIYMVHTMIGDPYAMPLYEAGEWKYRGRDPFRWHQFPPRAGRQVQSAQQRVAIATTGLPGRRRTHVVRVLRIGPHLATTGRQFRRDGGRQAAPATVPRVRPRCDDVS